MTASPPSGRPVMLFDGDCGFCRIWIERWRAAAGDAITFVPYQEAAGWYPDISPAALAAAVHLVEPDGRISRGAEAVARGLAAGGRRWPLRLYRLPGCAHVAEFAYRLVARHRMLFSRGTRWLYGPSALPSTWWLGRWLFLKGLALVYLAAFVSLLVQVDGLIGPSGILPAADYLDLARRHLGGEAYRVLPTLAWLHPGGAVADALCAGGAVLAVLLLAGLAPRWALVGLWTLYLSLVTIGQDFLSFQWDTLLLETGFLAIFLAPGGLRPGLGLARPPAAPALFLLRWTLFRLMFMAGAVKLLSGDPLWRHLTALTVHYETQPLPHALSWYAHQLPPAVQRASCLVMLVIELAVPFLIWAPRRLRQAAFAAFATLQGLIILTGNYGFFNLLALVLCLLLLDDRALRRLLPATLGDRLVAATERRAGPVRRLAGVAAAGVFLLTLTLMAARLLGPAAVPAPLLATASYFSPLRTFNTYGLFAVMTPERPEIQVEGSDDGRTWKAYRFRWKPGETTRRPGLAAPHMPRLDWQMWFAALTDVRRVPWFPRFMEALLEGRPQVLALLAENPFPDRPPRYVRAVLYRYRFTRGPGEDWWRREELGPYAPPMALRP